MDILPGEFVSVVGESGSGKTMRRAPFWIFCRPVRAVPAAVSDFLGAN